MNSIKVLGIGSPFGEDQVGWSVAQSLITKCSHLPVTIEIHDRPGIRLIELMNGATTVFLIDAIKSNDKIGTIHRFHNNEILTLENQLSTHNIGIAQALELGKALKALPDNIILYGITIHTSEFESTFSLPVKKAVEQVVGLLKNEIYRLHDSV